MISTEALTFPCLLISDNYESDSLDLTACSCLHRAIENGDPIEEMCELVGQYPGTLNHKNEHGENLLECLNRLHLDTVFSLAFRRRQVDCLFHDECEESLEWRYVAKVSSIILTAMTPPHQGEKRASTLHTALQICDRFEVPIDVMRLLIYTPSTSAAVEEKDAAGNLPLHLALSHLGQKLIEGCNEISINQCILLIEDLLDAYPGSVNIANEKGIYPIQILLELLLLCGSHSLKFEPLCCMFYKISDPYILAKIVKHYSTVHEYEKVLVFLSSFTTFDSLFETICEIIPDLLPSSNLSL